MTAVAPVLRRRKCPTPTEIALSSSDRAAMIGLPTIVIPVPAVRVTSRPPTVARLRKWKSKESPSAPKLSPDTKFAAVSVAFERAAPGVHFTMPTKQLAAVTTEVSSALVASEP